MEQRSTLSDDARRVLHLAARGLSTPEIARRLGWPLARVRAALVDALAALSAGSKLEALIIAIRRGLIDAECTRE